jgi:hypothetical protein
MSGNGFEQRYLSRPKSNLSLMKHSEPQLEFFFSHLYLQAGLNKKHKPLL